MHISKRGDISRGKAWGIRIGAILIALVICGIITMLTTGLDPIGVYGTMFDGAFGSERKIWVLFKELSLLLVVSLGLTPAFKMKFWNLGGEGQIMVGALTTAALMIYFGKVLPGPALILLAFIGAIGAGAIWAMIPAFFKAKWNTNETLFTLMMNYVAIQLTAYFIIIWEVPKGSGKVGIINQSSMNGWLPVIAHKQYLLVIVMAVIVTVAMHVYLKYSKHGYEIAVVGESQNTARYVGIKVDRVIIRTLLLSGGICGLVGWMMVSGTDHTITTTLSGGMGFTGVMVAWLAQFSPLGMVLASLLLAFLSRGASEISAIYQLNHAFGDIISGIIIFFIIGSEFYINYKVNFGGKDKGKAKSAPAVVTAEAADADAETEAADAAETADAADAEVTEDITTEDRKEGSDNV